MAVAPPSSPPPAVAAAGSPHPTSTEVSKLLSFHLLLPLPFLFNLASR